MQHANLKKNTIKRRCNLTCAVVCSLQPTEKLYLQISPSPRGSHLCGLNDLQPRVTQADTQPETGYQ